MTYGWPRDAVNWYGDGMGGGLLIEAVEFSMTQVPLKRSLRYE